MLKERLIEAGEFPDVSRAKVCFAESLEFISPSVAQGCLNRIGGYDVASSNSPPGKMERKGPFNFPKSRLATSTARSWLRMALTSMSRRVFMSIPL